MKSPKISNRLWDIYFKMTGKLVAIEDSWDQQRSSGVAWQCYHYPEKMIEQESIQGSRWCQKEVIPELFCNVLCCGEDITDGEQGFRLSWSTIKERLQDISVKPLITQMSLQAKVGSVNRAVDWSSCVSTLSVILTFFWPCYLFWHHNTRSDAVVHTRQ